MNQIHKVVSIYKESIHRRGVYAAKRYSSEEVADHHGRYPHLLWMCEEILSGKVDGEKAHRWLGFVQGVLFDDGQYTISQLQDHNK